MADYLSAGVYVEEVATAAQIVPGVTTSNMGIVGYAARGPANVATLVQSYDQFVNTFGGLVSESYLPLSMAAFFANGGRRAYVVRVPPADAVAADAKIQSVVTDDNVATGDGSATTVTGTLETATGAAPVVPGSVTVEWRKAGTPVSGQAARNADNTSNLTLVADQASYDGRINPASLPSFDPSHAAAVRGTVAIDFSVTASTGGPTQTINIPVGTGTVVTGSAGNATNGAVASFDHASGRFSLRTFGDFIPTAAKATLTTPVAAGASVLRAITGGTAGNSITLTFAATGAGAGTLAAVGTAYTFQYASGVTTVANFEAAVGAFVGCLFEVQTPGTPGLLTAPGATFGPSSFTGGATDAGNAVTVDFTPANGSLTGSMAYLSAQDARGSITSVVGASLVDGQTITISDGTNSKIFEFDSNGVTSGSNVPVPFTGADTAADVCTALIAAINATSGLLLSASVVSGATDKLRLLPNSSTAPGSVVLSTTSTCTVAPTVATASGIWVGNVSAGGSINYSTGAVSLPVTGFVPHNKAAVLATYTHNAWDLNPISVGEWGNSLRIQMAGSPNYFTAATATYSRFDLNVLLYNPTASTYSVVEQYEELVFDDPTSPVYFADVVNELSDYITVTEPAGDEAPGQLSGVPYTMVLAGGSALAANKTVSGILSNFPVQPRTISITYTSTGGTEYTIVDDGQGVLTSTGGGLTGTANTVDYETGAITFVTANLIKGGTLVVASYRSAVAETVHTETFGDSAKLYTSGTEGTFDGVNWGRDQFTNAATLSASDAGMYAFDRVDEILQVCIPDFAGNEIVAQDQLNYASTRAAAPHGGDRFIILTTPAGYSAQQAVDWYRFTLAQNSDYAALYWPWVRVTNPLNNNRPQTFPPMAHIAGIYARTDNNKNVGKSPGGTVDGALTYLVGLETVTTQADRDIVYPNRINPLISGAQTGLAVWGVRTISNVPDWRYINARRLFMFLEKSIYNSTWWAVFENNGPALWAKVTSQISSFLSNLFSQGYFAGSNPSQAFFVICDSSNNTNATIEAGQLVIDIGVAPSKPAEFIRLRFQQKSLNS